MEINITIIIQILIFLFLFFYLSKILFYPLNKLLQERYNRINGKKIEAQKINKNLITQENIIKEKIFSAKKEGNIVFEQLKKDGSIFKEQLIISAKEVAKNKIDINTVKIENEILLIRKELLKNSHHIVRSIIVKLINKKLINK